MRHPVSDAPGTTSEVNHLAALATRPLPGIIYEIHGGLDGWGSVGDRSVLLAPAVARSPPVSTRGATMDLWPPPEGVFIAGKPLTDIWAPPGLRWIETVRRAANGPLRHPYLLFTRRDHSWYDLDNLAHPVIAALGIADCDSIWAQVRVGEPEGVLIREEEPPPPDPRAPAGIYISMPSSRSRAKRLRPPELEHVEVIGDDEPLCLTVEFDASDVAVAALSYDGPLKSLIDDLTPLFGTGLIAGRLLAKDHRVKDLRIFRGLNPGGHGVRVRLWQLNDDDQPWN